MAINIGKINVPPPNWKTYDTNGDGKLTDAELTMWNNVVQNYKTYIDPNFEDTYEAGTATGTGTGTSEGTGVDQLDVVDIIRNVGAQALGSVLLNELAAQGYSATDIDASFATMGSSTPDAYFPPRPDFAATLYPNGPTGEDGNWSSEQLTAIQEADLDFNLDRLLTVTQANRVAEETDTPYVHPYTEPALNYLLGSEGADSDGDGVLSTEELGEYLADSGTIMNIVGSESEAASAIDQNQDGVISEEEYRNAVAMGVVSETDEDPNPVQTAFLADMGFDASPSAAWMEAFTRKSAASFQTGAQQILTQSLQDAGLAVLGMLQNGLLEQLESGEDTLSRPIIDKDAPAYSIFGAGIDSYFERIFDGKDTISRDALLTNDEFYHVGIKLATRNSSTPMLSAEGITLTDTDQALVDRYVAVRDDYREEANDTYAGDASAVTADEVASKRTELLAGARSPIAKAWASKITDDQIRDRIATERKNAAILARANEKSIYSPELLQKRDELVAAGITNAAAILENVDPFSELRPLLYEAAINKIGDAADALVARRDDAGGYSDLDPKTKNMLNLASFGIRAVGSMSETFAGALALVGETSSDSVLGRFGTALVNLASSIETQDFKDAADEVEARIGRTTGFWGTAKAIFGSGDIPLEFLLRQVLPEVGEEILLSKITGGTTKGVKFNGANSEFKEFLTHPANRPDGAPTWLKDKLAILVGKDELGDMAELIAGTAGEAYDRAYFLARDSTNPATGDPYTEEEARDFAYGVMGRATTGAFIVNRFAAGVSIDDMVENFFPGADNKAIREVLTAIQNNPTVKTFLSLTGEGASEGGEGAIAAYSVASDLVVLDSTINVLGEAGAAGALGTALGSLVDISMTGGFAIDNAASNVAAAFNTDINDVLTTARTELDAGANLADVTANMEESFNGMGLADVPLQTDILNGVDDASYTTGLETEEKFDELGYTPTEKEINEYIGKNNEAGTLNNIEVYVDPRQVTLEEAKDALRVQGINNPTDQEAAAYVGQGDGNFQSTKNTEIQAYADPRVIDDAEARAALQAQGIANPKQEEIDQFTGQGGVNFETSNIGKATDYANPLSLSTAEIEAAAAEQGYTLSTGEAEALSGRILPGQTEAEAIASQGNVFNAGAITEAELQAIADEQGYTLTDTDRALIGNNSNAAQALLNVENQFNESAITKAEINAAARRAGIDPKDLTESDYALVGNIAEKDAEGNFVPAGDILAGEQARFEGRVADATAAEQKAAAETAIKAAVTAAGAPALSATDLERYIGMVIGGGLTIAEAVKTVERDIEVSNYDTDAYLADADYPENPNTASDETPAMSAFDVQAMNWLFGRYGLDTNAWPEGIEIQGGDINGDGIYSADELRAIGFTPEIGADPKFFEDPEGSNTDSGDISPTGTDNQGSGNSGIRDQVVAAVTAAGVTLAADKIDEIIADIVSGAATDIDKAVADKVTEYQLGNDTDSGTDNGLEDSTIEGDPDDYVKVKDFNREVGALQDNVIELINELETAGATRDEALALAIGVPAGQSGGPSGIYAELGNFATSDQAEAIKKVVDGIATELGTTAADVVAIKSKLDTLVTQDDISGLATQEDVVNAEARLNTRIGELVTEGKTRLDALDIALGELAIDLGTTKEAITKQLTAFQTNLDADLGKLATKQDVLDTETRIRDKQDEYQRQGMKADEALEAAINDVATDLGTTKEAITKQLTEFQTNLDADLALLATKKQVNALETELYLKLSEYEAQGKTRDEATQLAIKDLATDLKTTEANLMTELGVTQDTLTNKITEVETNLTNQFNSQIESTKELITETATETQKQIQTTANQSAARDFFDMVLGSEDLEGQEVTVSQSPLAQINYIYDWQDPLANQQQRGFFGAASPYGESLAAGKSRRPQTIANVMQGPLNLQGAPVGPMGGPLGMAAGGKVDYDFLNEISQIMSFGE